MKLIHQEVESCEIPFKKERFLLYSHREISAPFHFVVFLRLFLIGEALLPWYGDINYQQRVIAVYINYGSRPSPHCAFMFHGCITSSDMKYLLWQVPVTLISPIHRCNFLLFLWKIAGKCDQSAGCRRQPAAGCYFEPWVHVFYFLKGYKLFI